MAVRYVSCLPLSWRSHWPRETADLRSAAIAYVRQPPTVETSRGGYTEFVHNVSLFRAEERIGLAIVRPSALCLISS
jgi:hypothetical protein